MNNRVNKRSYEVETERNTVRRNRRHIIPTEKIVSSQYDRGEIVTRKNEPDQTLPETKSTLAIAKSPTRIPIAVTRSGRQIKTPSWLKEFEGKLELIHKPLYFFI